jgi:hypothetical protein
MKYGGKVESASARRYRTNIAPQGGLGPYGQGSTITINIPTRNNTLMIPSESVLKFNFDATAADTVSGACFDSCGAHGVIQRLRIFSGSNLLEDIDQYSGLAKILMDFSAPLDSVQGRFSVTAGTTNEYIGTSNSTNTDVGSNIATQGISVRPTNRGRSLIPRTAATTASTIASGASIMSLLPASERTFSINLISMVGALCGAKYLPLFNATSAPLRLEIVLQPSIVNVLMIRTATAPSNFTVSNVEFIAEFVEIPDAVQNAIIANSSSPMQFVIPEYRNFQSTATVSETAVTTLSVPVPAKYSSLKSILAQTKVSNGALDRYPSASQNWNLNQYTWRIGSEVVPSNPVNNVADYYNEALKCFGSLADMNVQPAIDITSYNLPTAGADNVVANYAGSLNLNSGSFLVGIDTEVYQNSDKSQIFSGTNTNNSDIFYQPTFGAQGTGNPTTCFLNFYACYDNVLVFENGVVYSRY